LPRNATTAAKVATGLKDPIEVRAIDLSSPVPVLISDHAKHQWHGRVMPDRSHREALIQMVEMLESGDAVRTRTSPYQWVRSSQTNSLYFAVSGDIILPAEPIRSSPEILEVTTCMTNPVLRVRSRFRRRSKPRVGPNCRAKSRFRAAHDQRLATGSSDLIEFGSISLPQWTRRI
jgi:hypothetical protein